MSYTRGGLSSGLSRRDAIYIVKDLLLKLVEHGQLNQTALVSFCGLNLTKHKHIIDRMEAKGLILRDTETSGKRRVTVYRVSPRGLEFCRDILEPYERMFPRKNTKAAPDPVP